MELVAQWSVLWSVLIGFVGSLAYFTVVYFGFVGPGREGRDYILTFFWGASPAASDQDVSFIFNKIHASFPARVSDEEVGSTVSWMNADDDTNDISVTIADDVDRTIP